MPPVPAPILMIAGLLSCIALVAGAPASAAPAELPPASYTGAQYVDSTGCVFIRPAPDAEWEPRQTRDGQPLCGYEPTRTEPGPAAERAVEAAPAAPAPADRVPGLSQRLAALQPPRALTITGAKTIPGAFTACPDAPVTVQRYILSDGRMVMRCGPQIDDPAGFINGAGVRGLRVQGSDVPDLPLPATAAMLATLRDTLRQPPAAAPKVSGGHHVRSAPARLSPNGERYVQVGAFADPVNAERVKARLRALGLPVSVGAARIGGKAVQVIYAGPLTGEQAPQALRNIRTNGFRDAILR
ncbi:SPOR domain-containing protein [Paenirhodobacter populi]|uniref:SPOR domain-containing protein n=1 Tax=Paenirhodobacter populi TaxID=2306993 RepID=A0A443JVC6_9RHOB|nr:SPOR domain-containing protein [Sinirhodobacter populi]RWR24406.1 SPOR domain-containing protein [Sinirhodobacter populi]